MDTNTDMGSLDATVMNSTVVNSTVVNSTAVNSTAVNSTAVVNDTAILDAAFDRVAGIDFTVPRPFVNHAPMACEALTALGLEDRVDGWSRAMVERYGNHTPIDPVDPGPAFDWQGSLGHERQLAEWVGFFGQSIERDGWSDTVSVWVPRLTPYLSAALFHGVIRTAHAVRAIDTADTVARQAELSRALGNWAVWSHPVDAAVPGPAPTADDPLGEITEAAARGARCYVVHPTIYDLHGVTGAMAVRLLADHVAPADAAAALGQLRAEHEALYRETDPERVTEQDWKIAVVERAVASKDAHAVKLVEACRRGFAEIGDPAFAAAAHTVTDTGTGTD